jgi:energy-converting hydrogenase Eha subunit E
MGYLSGFFPVAGVAGSTATQQLLHCLTFWLVSIGTATVFTFFEPTLMTAEWFGFYAAVTFVPLVIVRSALEQACSDLDVAAYIAVTLASHFVRTGASSDRTREADW